MHLTNFRSMPPMFISTVGIGRANVGFTFSCVLGYNIYNNQFSCIVRG